MSDLLDSVKAPLNRRSFVKKSLMAAGAATMGAGLLTPSAFANTISRERSRSLTRNGSLGNGDAALLRFVAALETLEADFWIQYNELAGIQDDEVPGGSGNPEYQEKFEALDDDFPQYIHDNTDDEITHFQFLNAYLVSRGAQPVDLEQFRTLQGSRATGSSGSLRLTNLMQLTLDTSWYTRYRDDKHNPDLDPNFVFPQAIPGLAHGQFPAIPRTDDDLEPDAHLQAIVSTAAFHMPTIEQGGNSLYPSLAQRASDVEVLRILISIGPTETMHFQTWSDLAGDASADPIAPFTDPTNGLFFPNLNAAPLGGELFTTSLIMPEPCPFLSRDLPIVSVIRPTETQGAATGALNFLTAMGLFRGQSQSFFDFMTQLATAADAAQRQC
jgi:ferritin-like protein